MTGQRHRERVGGAGGDLCCSEVRPLVSALVDGEVDDLQRARIEKHIRGCARCREFELFLRRVSRVMKAGASAEGASSPKTVPARTLAHEVRRTRGEARRASWRSSAVGAAIAAALSLGMVIGGLGMWTLNQADAPEGESVQNQRSMPRVELVEKLDPGEVIQEIASILTAWVPPRRVENTFDEKAMYWTTPMSHFEQSHDRPERL